MCCPCSEERARRISNARSERAEDYGWARLAQSARAQLEQRREAEAAAAEAGEGAAAELEKRPEVTLLIKADVQARFLKIPHACAIRYVSDRPCNSAFSKII